MNTSLVRSVTPQILALQQQSREPITVYIDSPGGNPQAAIDLVRLIRSPSQDDKTQIRIITVAVTEAYSAAADLLAFGDYALAYSHTKILFHGGRISAVTELTAERSSAWANFLRITNESSALDLAREVQLRFMLLFVSSRGSFQAVRDAAGKPKMSDLDCLFEQIYPKVSASAQKILNKARARYGRYELLVEAVLRARKKIKTNKTPAEIEAIELRAIVDFEVKQNANNPAWSFQHGIEGLTDDFLLFKTYEDVLKSDRYKRLCDQYGSFLVEDAEGKELDGIKDDNERIERWTERVSPTLKPIWAFFVALCQTLQQGEDEFLTATDAYWLGLIDEVIGEEGLVHLRFILETAEEIKAKKAAEAAASEPAALPAAGSSTTNS
jgi:ATP-dependent protease ClpP protease subunit